MNNIQTFADKAAISLSLLCAIHCLAFPLAVVALPTVAALNLDGEVFHLWLLVVVIPASLVALCLGCRKHNNYSVLITGLTGLAILVIAAWLAHDLGETLEKALTLTGAVIIAMGHFYNHRLCQQTHCHQCSS